MGCVSLETGWYYLDYDEKGKRIGRCDPHASCPRCGIRLSFGLSDPCGVLCSGIRDGEGPPLDGSRLPHYWNPAVKLDDTGQATVEFYTSDAPADYDITIEGITQTGKIVRTVKIITE